jgi:hypothetical protein
MQNSTFVYLRLFRKLLMMLFFSHFLAGNAQVSIGGVSMGDLPNYLFVFTNASQDANWQSASKGFSGDVAVDGTVLKFRTSGHFAYAGTIFTNTSSIGKWQGIIDDNKDQAQASYGQEWMITNLKSNLEYVFSRINSLTVTPGFESRSAVSLNGLNYQNNGIADVIVINITSGFQVKTQINITGDADDIFILRWDDDANFSNGYDGQVKFQSGGAIVPQGALTAANFVHVAGDINASGGGGNPSVPYPQGPRMNNGTGDLIQGGADWKGGGFFTGYWFTTGKPSIFPGNEQPYGETASLSNAIFVGGWYSKTSKFSMTSGTSGVHVSPGSNSSNSVFISRNAPSGNETLNVNNGSVRRPLINSERLVNELNNKKQMLQTNSTVTIDQVYPNPFVSKLNLQVQSGKAGPVTISIIDNSGRIVKTQQTNLQQGLNMVTINQLERLNGGIYFIQVKSTDGFITNTIVK